MASADPRRRVPRTDAVLADPQLLAAAGTLGRAAVKAAVVATLQRVRDGELAPADAVDAALAALPRGPRPVLNATGVVLHTNLGRAALSAAAREAIVAAAGHTDVELDLETGRRARRGRATMAALAAAVPAAGDVHVVNNGAAALVLAATALAAGREIIVSRGEMVEIGDGFRLPDLLESTGARLREVGTTNRTTLRDYERAIGPHTGFILKVHPSNFVIRGFTSDTPVAALATLDPPVVADIGSGLLHPDPLLPGEPDATTTLTAGAALVTASGDKLLGGPQAGLLLGEPALIERLRRHPLARALRVDKLTLAALQATLTGPLTPTWQALRADPSALRTRTEAVRAHLAAQGIPVTLTESSAVVGGGGAPEVTLPSWSLSLPETYAHTLRTGATPVVGRVERGHLLLDLRCVPVDADPQLTAAILTAGRALASTPRAAIDPTAIAVPAGPPPTAGTAAPVATDGPAVPAGAAATAEAAAPVATDGPAVPAGPAATAEAAAPVATDGPAVSAGAAATAGAAAPVATDGPAVSAGAAATAGTAAPVATDGPAVPAGAAPSGAPPAPAVAGE